jgi:mono/diheme cytochrome c family protein
MKRVLKWLGYIVGGLVLLIAVGVGTVYAITSSRLGKTYPTTVENVAIPGDPASIERGKHLVTAVGKCQDCHGANFTGTRMMDAAVFMKLTAPNLTAGKGGIGSTYTDADWVRAIRYGVGRDGKPLVFMPSEAYTRFSDSDLGAMIAYLKTLPPADETVERVKSVGPIARIVYLTSGFPMIPAELIDRNISRAAVAPGVTVEYGKYLSESGGCTSCHLPTLAGGVKMDKAVSANLTPGGPLKSWTEADFFKAIRTGTRPDGTKISEEMPWKAMASMTDDELRATWLFLRSVPPVATVVTK